MNNNLYENLHGLYSISKTLRFELKPIGKTEENFTKSDILNVDRHLKESYEKLKLLINEVHKDFINTTLLNLKLKNLKNYYEYLLDYKIKSKNERKISKERQKEIKD